MSKTSRSVLILCSLFLTVTSCSSDPEQSVSNTQPTVSNTQPPEVSYPENPDYEGVPDTLTVFSINDLHGKVDGANGYHSILDLDACITSDPRYDPQTSIIVSAGDSWQGSYASGYDYGETTTKLMGLLGVSVMELGNHEFDWGISRIKQNMDISNFPFICSNLVDADGNKVDWIDSYATVEVGDYTCGFVGVMGPTLESDIKTGMLEGNNFSDDISLVEQAYKDCIASGADSVFLIAHEDAFSGYLSRLTSTLDFSGVFCGHTHQFESSTLGSSPAVQGGSDNRGYSYMVLNTASGDVSDYGYVELDRAIDTAKPSSNQGLKDYLDWYLNSLPRQVFGKIEGYWTKETSANFVLSAMLYAYRVIYPDMPTDHLISIHNTGGIRGYYPEYDEPTDFDMDTIQIVSPFDNKLVLLQNRAPDYGQIRRSNGRNYVSDYESYKWDYVDIVTIDYLVTDEYSKMFSPEGAIYIQDPNRGGDYVIYNVVADYASYLDSQNKVIRAQDYREAVYPD